MRQGFMALAAVLALGGTGVPASADDASEIKAVFGRLVSALKSGRYEDTLKLETPDFKATTPGGVVDGKQMVAMMKAQAKQMTMKQMDIKITRMDIKGKQAVVLSAFTSKAEVVDAQGQMGPKGAKHTLEMSGMTTNQLEKTKDGWKFKTFEQKPGRMLLDGKPMGGPPAGGGAPPKPRH
jgi:hypothetical protein